MAFTHAVELKLLTTGTTIDVWDGYDIGVDMFKPGAPWTFSLWHSRASESPDETVNRRTAWRTLVDEAKCGDLISFAIDGAVQMVGAISNIKLCHSKSHGHMMVLSGRDLAAEAIDWDASPRVNLRGAALNDVLAQLFGSFGVAPVFGADADGTRQVRVGSRPGSRGLTTHRRGQIVDRFHPKPGERIWQLVEVLLRRLGLMAWVAPNETLLSVVIDVPNYSQDPVFYFKKRFTDPEQSIATEDSNVISADYDIQTRDVPTSVTVYGTFGGGDARDGRHSVTVQNTELTNFMVSQNPIPHPRHIHSTRARTQYQATQEANRVIADAMKDHRLYTCTVQGHGQPQNGGALPDSPMQLYTVNTMAHVRDSLCGFPPNGLDEPMLIQRVQFTGSRAGGQTTKVTLGAFGAIVLTPASDSVGAGS